MTIPRVLCIGGSDSSGGAGIQADVKTVTALGGYATTAVTALTAQTTIGVLATAPVSADFVLLQILAVIDDLGTDAIKTGMLASAAIVDAVAEGCARARSVPIVVDPVFESTSGTSLLDGAGRELLIRRLLPRAALVTPNVSEAMILSETPIRTPDGAVRAAERILLRGPSAVLVKGAHLEGDTVTDILLTADGDLVRFDAPRIVTRAGHGTGCTLASAIALGLAEGLTLRAAVGRARDFVRSALHAAPGLGKGPSPLHHAFARKPP